MTRTLKISFQAILCLCIAGCAEKCLAQNYARNWAMSYQTTLTFSGGNITTSPNSSIVGYPASLISASDNNGDLMFFSSGHALYDASQSQMPNGDSIFLSNNWGNVYLPHLTDTNRYYVFVNGDPNGGLVNKLRSSTVDMSLNGGLGDVVATEKNQHVINETLDFGLAATAHRDGQRAWLIADAWQSSQFKLILVGDGVDTTFFISSLIGNDSNDFMNSYALRFSPNGKYLSNVCSLNGQSTILIYSFDNETGKLRFERRIIESETNNSAASNHEFSSNSNFLYYSKNNDQGSATYLFQVELGNDWTVSYIDSFPVVPRMQLDPERRILLSYQYQNLGAILNPNEPVASLILSDSVVSFEPEFIDSFFPYYISNWFNTSFCSEHFCLGDSTAFYYAGYRMDSAIWDFGDPASGSSNTASGLEAWHIFSDTGWYDVTLYATTGAQTDTIVQSVHIATDLATQFSLPIDTSFCQGEVVDFNIDATIDTFIWSDSITTLTRSFDSSGVYSLVLQNSCSTISDTMEVLIDSLLPVVQLVDTALCIGDSVITDSTSLYASQWKWSNQSLSSSIALDTSLSPDLSPVDIWLIATNACGSDSDTMTLSFIPLPDAGLPPDSVQCFEAPVQVMRADQDSTIYTWNDGTDDASKLIEQDTVVWLIASNVCGSDTDSMHIRFHPEIQVELGEDTFLCEGDSVVLNASWPQASYSWVPVGSTDSTLSVHYEDLEVIGEEIYVVTITEGPCSIVESRKISIQDEQCDSVACKFDVANVFTPNGDGINDVLRITNPCKDLNYRVSIYNRWGQLVFFGNSSFSRWDGTVNGELASEGTYYVVVEPDGVSVQRNGVTLLR